MPLSYTAYKHLPEGLHILKNSCPNSTLQPLNLHAMNFRGLATQASFYMQRGKRVCPTYPPDIALRTFDSNNFGLSLKTAAAS